MRWPAWLHPIDCAYGVIGVLVTLGLWAAYRDMTWALVGGAMLLAYAAGGAKYRSPR